MAQYTQEALEEIEYVSGPADSEWGKTAGGRRVPRAVPAALRRDRQRGLVRPLGQLRRPVHADGQGDPRALPAAEDHRHRAGEELQARPVRRPLLPQRAAADAAGRPVRQADRGPAPLKFNGGGCNGRQPDGILTFVGEWATQEGRPDAEPQRRTGRRRVRHGPGEELGRRC